MLGILLTTVMSWSSKIKVYAIAAAVGATALAGFALYVARMAQMSERAKVQQDVLNSLKVEADETARIRSLDAGAARDELRRKWTKH